MTGLVCLLTIIISNWSISTISAKNDLVQIYVKGQPMLVKPLVEGTWRLYLHTYEQEEVVAVGPHGLEKEGIKTKRYFLQTPKETIILTPHNFVAIIRQQFPDEYDLYQQLDQEGFRFGNLVRVIERCNAYQQQMVVVQ